MTNATKYATLAVKHDRYNAKVGVKGVLPRCDVIVLVVQALVNMGNCLLERGELGRAKELYLESIGAFTLARNA